MIKESELEAMANQIADTLTNMIASTGPRFSKKALKVLRESIAASYEAGWKAAAEFERAQREPSEFVGCEVQQDRHS